MKRDDTVILETDFDSVHAMADGADDGGSSTRGVTRSSQEISILGRAVLLSQHSYRL
jgi:hypothetical protein